MQVKNDKSQVQSKLDSVEQSLANARSQLKSAELSQDAISTLQGVNSSLSVELDQTRSQLTSSLAVCEDLKKTIDGLRNDFEDQI